MAIVWAYALVAAGIPMLTLILTALTRGPGLAPVPANWTLANFSSGLDGGAAIALARSAGLALAAAVLAPALGALVAGLARGRWRGPLATVVTLAYALPGSALAVGIIIGYGRWLDGSALIILTAYLAKFWVFGHRPVQAALDRLPPGLTRAARLSGAGPGTAARTVVLPPLTVAAATAAGLVFVLAFHELTMSTILYGPGTETFAVVIMNQQDLGGVGATAALALVLTAPVVIVAALTAWLTRRTGPSARTSVFISERTVVPVAATTTPPLPDAVACAGLSVGYGRPALAGLDLAVAPGETLALLGSSGSGKTTLLNAIAGFVAPLAGQIWLAGQLASGPGRLVPPERRRIGMVFQDYALWPHLSVVDTVAYPLRRAGASKTAARRGARDILEQMSLGPLAERRPGPAVRRRAAARRPGPRPGGRARPVPVRRADRPPGREPARPDPGRGGPPPRRRRRRRRLRHPRRHRGPGHRRPGSRPALRPPSPARPARRRLRRPSRPDRRPPDRPRLRPHRPPHPRRPSPLHPPPRRSPRHRPAPPPPPNRRPRHRRPRPCHPCPPRLGPPSRPHHPASPDDPADLPGTITEVRFRGPHTDYHLATPAGPLLIREPGPPRAAPGPVRWSLLRLRLLPRASAPGRGEPQRRSPAADQSDM